MNDILLEALGGIGAVITAFLYTKWQTNLNHKEIEEIKDKMDENEKQDAARDTKIAILETQNSAVISRLEKMEDTLQKIFEKINNIG
jgi:septal ring factor EnvC (AmiA/AmiB activator)